MLAARGSLVSGHVRTVGFVALRRGLGLLLERFRAVVLRIVARREGLALSKAKRVEVCFCEGSQHGSWG